MSRRWLPSWRTSVALLVVWLLLVGEVSLAQLLLGGTLALLVPLLSERLRDEHGGARRPLLIARLALVVLRDIVVCNVQVAKLILGPRSQVRSGFVWVPLDMRNLHGITALTGIITMTPGTLSCELSLDRRYLLIHCLDIDDPDAVVAQIKADYERPLMEIFPS